MKNIRFRIYALFLLTIVFSVITLCVDYYRHKDLLQIIAEKKQEPLAKPAADDLAGELSQSKDL